MDQLQEVALLARQVLDRLVERVCGACKRNCCHQGTMMGSQDLRRLVRGLAVDPDLASRLREGLREKAGEVMSDVCAARHVAELLRTAGLGAERDMAILEKRTEELAEFAEMIAGELPLDYEHLRRVTLHSALRHNLLRAFRAFEGGEGSLARFAGQTSSFRYRGRRLAPPRCVFHSMTMGCLAGRWKPAKCANFFCTADPSLLDAIRNHMDFDDFVLSAFERVSFSWLLHMLNAETALGPKYHEPMVVLGLQDADVSAVVERLEKCDTRVAVQEVEALPATAAATERLGQEVPEGDALILRVPTLCATELYEIAIGLDRLRQADQQRLIIVAPHAYLTPSRPPHRLWAEHTISQPVGYLECYIVWDGNEARGPRQCEKPPAGTIEPKDTAS